MTMTLIETKTLGTAAASIAFTSIPQTFTDLVLVASLRGSTSSISDDPIVRFNSDTGNNYSYRSLLGQSGSVSSGVASPVSFNYLGQSSGNSATANTFGNQILYIANYTSSSAKSSSADSVNENNGAENQIRILANLWTGTAAITTINITLFTGVNFVVGSTISLYGILKGSSGGVTVS